MPAEPSEDVQAVLAAMRSIQMPDINDLEPHEARELMSGALSGSDPVEAVGSVTDREIPGPNGEIPIRAYIPAADGPHPVVVFFHGGGFVLGDIDGHDASCRILTNAADAVVVSVGYRLAPEHPFPEPVEDAYAATEWAAANAGEFGGDADRLAVAGDSAGGNLAAVVALAARDRGGPDIDHQTLFYPLVDFLREGYLSREENAESYFLTAKDMEYFHGHYVGSWVHKPNPYLSPILAPNHADLPPATVLTCGFDPLRDEGRAYADALESDGTAVRRHNYDDLIHGVINMVQEPMDVQGGHDALDDAAGDLRDALH